MDMSIAASEEQIAKPAVRVRYLEYGLIAIMLCCEAFFLQWLGDAWSSEYGSYPDESAHYVTALMAHDYLLSGEYSDPLSFANEYYAHYPKVAIGHWPPVFYALLGLWFVIFGVSRISAMGFIAVIATTTSLAIYHIAKTRLGVCAGLFAALIFLALPFVQQSTNAVMLGHLVTLFTLVSIRFLAKFLASEKLLYGLVFSITAALAILTRGSAWAIGLMPIFTMIFAWRFKMLARPIFWVSAIPVLLLCVPWYVVMPSLNIGAFAGESIFNFEFTQQAIPHFAIKIYQAIGLVLLVPIILGVWSKIVSPLIQKKEVDFIWAALGALIVATYTMHIFVAASFDSRYMLSTMPAFVLFAVAGINWIIYKVIDAENGKLIIPMTYILIAAVFLATKFYVPSLANTGYENALLEISKQTNVEQQAILVASSSIGEGTVIAAAASSQNKNNFILRGSKLLVEQDWYGRVLEEKFKSATEISEFLQTIPVNAVILDTALDDDGHRKYHDQLKTMLFANNQEWQLIGKFPVVKYEIEIKDALLVFVAKTHAESQTAKQVDINYIQALYGRSQAKLN